MPLLLEEVRAGNPDADVTILVATGGHRATTRKELVERYGQEMVDKERIVVHDSHDESSLVHVGTLPSGGDFILNKLVVEADLVAAEGFIEPHFFAGYSGSRKSVLPGWPATRPLWPTTAPSSSPTIRRTGIIRAIPSHRHGLRRPQGQAGFICNVVIDSEKKVGDLQRRDGKGPRGGCEFMGRYGKVRAVPADISSPATAATLDQNLYQAVKSMTAGRRPAKRRGYHRSVSARRPRRRCLLPHQTVPTPQELWT